MKTALISGITGQDGSYLAEFLLQKVTSTRYPPSFFLIQYRTYRAFVL